MRHLRDAKIDLDDDAMTALSERIADFLRVGSYTLSEWESLSPVEQAVALRVKKMLKLEDAILQRRADQAQSLDDVTSLINDAGDKQTAARMVLGSAVREMAAARAEESFR